MGTVVHSSFGHFLVFPQHQNYCCSRTDHCSWLIMILWCPRFATQEKELKKYTHGRSPFWPKPKSFPRLEILHDVKTPPNHPWKLKMSLANCSTFVKCSWIVKIAQLSDISARSAPSSVTSFCSLPPEMKRTKKCLCHTSYVEKSPIHTNLSFSLLQSGWRSDFLSRCQLITISILYFFVQNFTGGPAACEI